MRIVPSRPSHGLCIVAAGGWCLDADTIVNFGLTFYNKSDIIVGILSARLGSPSGANIGHVSFRAYSARKAPTPMGLQGDLPATCARLYLPHPVTAVVAKPHAEARWLVVTSLEFLRPGRFKVGTVKISYSAAGHHGWQLFYAAVTVTAVPVSENPGLAEPYRCSSA